MCLSALFSLRSTYKTKPIKEWLIREAKLEQSQTQEPGEASAEDRVNTVWGAVSILVVSPWACVAILWRVAFILKTTLSKKLDYISNFQVLL